MKISFTALVVVAACVSQGAALPDFLAPIKSILGMQKNGGGGGGRPYLPKSSASQPKQFSRGTEESDPFNSNFGFDNQYGRPSQYGNPGRPSSSPQSRPVRQQQQKNYSRRPAAQYSSSPKQHSSGFNGPASFGGFENSPASSSPYSGGGGGSSQSVATGSKDHFPRPEGPPTNFRGAGHGHEEDSTPYKYQDGPPNESDWAQGGGPQEQGQHHHHHHHHPASFSGAHEGGPYHGSPPPSSSSAELPFPYNEGSDGDDGVQAHHHQEQQQQGPGFTGFGSFPSEHDDEHQHSPQGGPPRGHSAHHEEPVAYPVPRPQSYLGGSPPSAAAAAGWFEGSSGGVLGDNANPPFVASSPGGSSKYSEGYEAPSRGTRNPAPQPHVIISGNELGKYPAQLAEDGAVQGGWDEGPVAQAGGDFGGFGGGGFRGKSPPWAQRKKAQGGGGYGNEEHSPQAPWAQRKKAQVAPYGGAQVEEEPISFPAQSPSPSPTSGRGGDGGWSRNSGQGPSYQPRRTRHQPKAQNPSYPSRAVVAGGVEHAQSMMSSASSDQKVIKVPRRLRKKFSAKIPQPQGVDQLNHPAPIVLVSPKDPNYEASSLNPMVYEPETAASGHGHEGGGGHEGLSDNGDRILYHVSGHKGQNSYRFGYDTGKGYNRLFRFEEKDGKGYVTGKYGFYDKHGKLQVIKYEAHPKHGFHADRASPH